MELSTQSSATSERTVRHFFPPLRIAYEAYRASQVQTLLAWFDDSPSMEQKAKTVIRPRIIESVDCVSRYEGWGVAFSVLWNWLAARCLATGLLAYLILCVVQSLTGGVHDYVGAILVGVPPLILSGMLFVSLYGYIPFFKSNSWGSFRALAISCLFAIAAEGTSRSAWILPPPIRIGVIAAMIATAIWTGIFLFAACGASIIAAINLQRLRTLFPAECMIDSLCRATKSVEDWTGARATLHAADVTTPAKEIASHTSEAAEARSEALWQLESIACGIEQHWRRMLARGQDKATVDWLRDQARRMAAYVRKQKQEILLPGALSEETATGAADLAIILGGILVHAAWGNWAAFEKADTPATPQPSRLPTMLRDAVGIAVPLVIFGVLLLHPGFNALPETVMSPIAITLVSLSVVRVVTLANPQIRDDLATVKDGISLLPRGGG